MGSARSAFPPFRPVFRFPGMAIPKSMKILFLHGWQSAPGGVKPTYLDDNGCDVIEPQLDDDDFDLAVRTAQAAFDGHRPEVVVGSSRGGAVAMNLQFGDTKLVLLCPAWKKWGIVKTVPAGTIILHSHADDVIPFEDSAELARGSGATLIEIGKDHRLADPESLSVMLWACKLTAAGEQLPWLDDEHPLDRRSDKKGKTPLQEEASYLCHSCGEEIVVPLDLSEGASQTYVEDCPVCCHANVIHVHVDEQGNATVDAEPEQD